MQRITTVPEVPLYDYMDGFGNVCTRLTMPAGGITLSCSTIEDAFIPDAVAADAQAVPVSDLPDEIMVYLLGSRYCETDRLVDIAWPLFSRITPGWAQVQAIVAYTHQRIAFGYEHARPTDRLRCLAGTDRCLPRLCPSGDRPVPLHEHPRPLLHRLSGGYGPARRGGRHGFRMVRGVSWPGAGTLSMPAITARAPGAS
jgi:hypothetical protein